MERGGWAVPQAAAEIAAHAAARTYSPNDAMPLVDAGRLGEYLDILKRSVGRLSEHGHAD